MDNTNFFKQFLPATEDTPAEKGRRMDASYDQMERMFPDFVRIMYPRVISTTPACGRFFPAKNPARHFAASAIQALRHFQETETVESDLQPLILSVAQFLDHGGPQVWVAEEMALAIRNTTPPMTLDWVTMKLPFPAMVLMVPRGALVHPTQGDTRFITVARAEGGVHYRHPLIPMYLEVPSTMLTVSFYTEAGLSNYQSFSAREMPVIALNSLDRTVEQFRSVIDRNQPGSAAVLAGPEGTFLKELLHFTFGALLIMEQRPDLLERGELQNRVKMKKGEGHKEFWSPTVLGPKYHVRRQPGDPQGGTHASPRLHWVRGFWREQPYGPGRELRRMVWIEPFTRGASEE